MWRKTEGLRLPRGAVWRRPVGPSGGREGGGYSLEGPGNRFGGRFANDLLWNAALRVKGGGLANAPDPDFLLALTGLRDVERRLHPHEGIHIHAESLFNP
jgi:hypothetical protein